MYYFETETKQIQDFVFSLGCIFPLSYKPFLYFTHFRETNFRKFPQFWPFLFENDDSQKFISTKIRS